MERQNSVTGHVLGVLHVYATDNHCVFMQERLHATTLWNVATHNTDDLNRVTQYGYRVYAILKVGVALYHPTNVVLELRKRICMKVYKKSALSAFTRSANRNVSAYSYTCTHSMYRIHTHTHMHTQFGAATWMRCDV